MTLNEQLSNFNPLSSLHKMRLHCSSDVVVPGGKLHIDIEKDSELKSELLLYITLLFDTGNREISIQISSLQKDIHFDIPKDIAYGDYYLVLSSEKWIFDKIPIFITDDESVEQDNLFRNGLELRVSAIESLENRDYAKAIALNQQAIKYYVESGRIDIAANAWKDLGISLLHDNQIDEAKQSFEQAIILFRTIKDSKGEAVASYLLNKVYVQLLTDSTATNKTKSISKIRDYRFSSPIQFKKFQFEEAQRTFERGIELCREIKDFPKEEDYVSSFKDIYDIESSFIYTYGEIDKAFFHKQYRDLLGAALTVRSRPAREGMLELFNQISKFRFQTWHRFTNPVIISSSTDTIDLQHIKTSYVGRFRENLKGALGKFNTYLLTELVSSLAKSISNNEEIYAMIQIKYTIESNGAEISFSITNKNQKKNSTINEFVKKDNLLSFIKIWSDSEKENITYYKHLARVAGAELSTQDNTTEGFIRISEQLLSIDKKY